MRVIAWHEFYAAQVLEIHWYGVVTPDDLVAGKRRLLEARPERLAGWRVVSDYMDCTLDLRRVEPVHYAATAMVDGIVLGCFPGGRWAAVMRPGYGPEGSVWMELLEPARRFHHVDGRLFLSRDAAWDWILHGVHREAYAAARA